MINLEFQNDPNLTYETIVAKFKSHAEIRKQEFLKNFSPVTELPITELQPNEAIEFLRDLCLFPSSDLIRLFRHIGFKEDRLQWFISLEMIVEEIDKINSRNIINIKPPNAILSLIYYILSKAFSSGTSDWFEYKRIPNSKELRRKHLFSKEYDRIKRNLNDRKVYKEDDSQVIFDLINEMKLALGEEFSHSVVEALLGNPEIAFLQPFYKHNVIKQSPKLSESRVFKELYDLIQLIAKDENLPLSTALYANNYESKVLIGGYGTPGKFIATKLKRLLKKK
jgi:hypothetical protein